MVFRTARRELPIDGTICRAPFRNRTDVAALVSPLGGIRCSRVVVEDPESTRGTNPMATRLTQNAEDGR